jgi:hypothetical protein
MEGIKVLPVSNVYTLLAAGLGLVFAFGINRLQHLLDGRRQFRHGQDCEITSPPHSVRGNALVSITV